MIHANPVRETPRHTIDEHPIQSEHIVLGGDGARIERLLGSLAQGAPDGDARRRLQPLLEAYRGRLVAHFQKEERAGVLDQAVDAEPRFERLFSRLRREHVELRARMDAIVATLVEDAGQRGWRQCHARFFVFLEDLRVHEATETELLQRAYLEDLGGEQ